MHTIHNNTKATVKINHSSTNLSHKICRKGLFTRALKPALGIAWKYALKIAPSLCLLKEKVTNMTFPEDVSFMTGDEPEIGNPHHLRQVHAAGV